MSKVTHFEVYVDDPDAAMEFYRNVFDWSFERNEDSPAEYWQIQAGDPDEPGIEGGLLRWDEEWGERGSPGWGYICNVSVEDVDDAVERVREHGGDVTVEVMEIPGVGRQAYCTDPAGNTFAIMENSMEQPTEG